MLKLPSKRWKKARLTAEGEGRYALTVLTPMKSERELEKIVEEDIKVALNKGDKVTAVKRDATTVMLEISDCEAFKRRLALQNIIIEE